MRVILWLGVVAVLLAVFGYLDQEIRCLAPWDWSQFWHHETLVVLSLTVGLTLLIIRGVLRRGVSIDK